MKRKEHGFIRIMACVILCLAIIIILFSMNSCSPVGVAIWNTYDYAVQKTEDVTNYKVLKKVEDSCRSMIASYEADKLTWEQYKNSDNEEKQNWAEQAKMRANKTAATYNNYILENSFVWKSNVPADIREKLPYLG